MVPTAHRRPPPMPAMFMTNRAVSAVVQADAPSRRRSMRASRGAAGSRRATAASSGPASRCPVVLPPVQLEHPRSDDRGEEEGRRPNLTAFTFGRATDAAPSTPTAPTDSARAAAGGAVSSHPSTPIASIRLLPVSPMTRTVSVADPTRPDVWRSRRQRQAHPAGPDGRHQGRQPSPLGSSPVFATTSAPVSAATTITLGARATRREILLRRWSVPSRRSPIVETAMISSRGPSPRPIATNRTSSVVGIHEGDDAGRRMPRSSPSRRGRASADPPEGRDPPCCLRWPMRRRRYSRPVHSAIGAADRHRRRIDVRDLAC